MKKTLLSVNDPGFGYASMYEDYFEDVTDDISILYNNPERVGMVSFTGGEDVHPSWYGEEVGYRTGASIMRDTYEKDVFDTALDSNIPMVGICRGSQFLNVMCGGRMVQDVTNHAGSVHKVKTYKGEEFLVNSTHHQMSVVTDSALLLAYASPGISKHYFNGDNIEEFVPEFETESFYYPEFNVIGWQYHPEMIKGRKYRDLTRCVEFVYETLEELILNNKVIKNG